MKRVLQNIPGLIAIVVLAIAVIWLVQSVPRLEEQAAQPTATRNQPEPVEWKTTTPLSRSQMSLNVSRK